MHIILQMRNIIALTSIIILFSGCSTNGSSAGPGYNPNHWNDDYYYRYGIYDHYHYHPSQPIPPGNRPERPDRPRPPPNVRPPRPTPKPMPRPRPMPRAR